MIAGSLKLEGGGACSLEQFISKPLEKLNATIVGKMAYDRSKISQNQQKCRAGLESNSLI